MTCPDCPGVPEAVCLKDSQFELLVSSILGTNVTPVIENFSGNVEESLAGVSAGDIGRIVSVGENGGGDIHITIDGTTPTAINGFTINATTQCFQDIKGVALDQVRLIGSVPASSYFIAYEVYN